METIDHSLGSRAFGDRRIVDSRIVAGASRSNSKFTPIYCAEGMID
jgi:hypothetical protein